MNFASGGGQKRDLAGTQTEKNCPRTVAKILGLHTVGNNSEQTNCTRTVAEGKQGTKMPM